MKKLLGNKANRRCGRAFWDLRQAIRSNAVQIVADTLGCEPAVLTDPALQAGLVLFYGLAHTGPVPLYISRVSGIERRRVARMAWRARKAGIFRGGGVYADPWVEDAPAGIGTLNFVLDAMIVAGIIDYQGPRGPDRLYGPIIDR